MDNVYVVPVGSFAENNKLFVKGLCEKNWGREGCKKWYAPSRNF